MASLRQIEADTEFQALTPNEQDEVRLGFLRRHVLSDPDFQALAPEQKSTVSTRIMGGKAPEGFLESLYKERKEAILGLPGALATLTAAPIPPPPDVPRETVQTPVDGSPPASAPTPLPGPSFISRLRGVLPESRPMPLGEQQAEPVATGPSLVDIYRQTSLEDWKEIARAAGKAIDAMFAQPLRQAGILEPAPGAVHEAELPGWRLPGSPNSAEEILRRYEPAAELLAMFAARPFGGPRTRVARISPTEAPVDAWATAEGQALLRRLHALQERVIRGSTPAERQASAAALERVMAEFGIGSVEEIPGAKVNLEALRRPQPAIPERIPAVTPPEAPKMPRGRQSEPQVAPPMEPPVPAPTQVQPEPIPGPAVPPARPPVVPVPGVHQAPAPAVTPEATTPVTPPAEPAPASASPVGPAAPTAEGLGLTLGGRSIVHTERGTEVATQFAVVEADQPIVSHDLEGRPNPQYDQDLQARDRSRVASLDQVQTTARNLYAPWLADSPKASEGAPIVGPDLMVESGNNRMNAIRLAYQTKAPTAEAYREWLAANAETFGFTAEQVTGMRRPVLVRMRRTDVDRVRFAQEANEAAIAAMSAVEVARVDAQRMTPQLLSLFVPSDTGILDTRENLDFIRAFMELMPAADRGRMMTAQGTLSQEAVTRVRNAIFAKAYQDPSAIARLAEDLDNNVRNITTALVNAAPRMVAIKSNMDAGTLYNHLDLGPDLTAAMQKLAALRAEGTAVSAYMQQQHMFGEGLSPVSRDVLAVFDKFARSAKRVQAVLDNYARVVETVGSPAQGGLFGQAPPTLAEAFRTAVTLATEESDAGAILGQAGGGIEAGQPRPSSAGPGPAVPPAGPGYPGEVGPPGPAQPARGPEIARADTEPEFLNRVRGLAASTTRDAGWVAAATEALGQALPVWNSLTGRERAQWTHALATLDQRIQTAATRQVQEPEPPYQKPPEQVSLLDRLRQEAKGLPPEAATGDELLAGMRRPEPERQAPLMGPGSEHVGRVVRIFDGPNKGRQGTVTAVKPHPARGLDIPIFSIRTAEGSTLETPSNIVRFLEPAAAVQEPPLDIPPEVADTLRRRLIYDLREAGSESDRQLALAALADLARGSVQAVSTSRRRALPARSAPGSPKLLGLSIPRNLPEKGFIDLRGTIIRDARDIGVIGQIYRDPRYETFRIIYTKTHASGEEAIVGHEGFASRLPGAAPIYAEEKAGPRMAYEIRRRMERLGADTYYLLHNQPSGDSTPSTADRAVTRRLAGQIRGFGGHVVIDAETFSLINEEGRVMTFPLAEPHVQSDPGLAHPLLGQRLGSAKDVADLGAALKPPRSWVALLYQRANGRLTAIQEVPVGLFNQRQAFTEYLRGRLKEFGAIRVAAYLHAPSPAAWKLGESYVQSGILLDFVGSEGLQFYGMTDAGEIFPAFKKRGIRVEESAGEYDSLLKKLREETAESEAERPQARRLGATPPVPGTPPPQAPSRAAAIRMDLVQKFREALAIPIRTGRVGGSRRRLGAFWPRREVIRTRIYHDIPTLSHEVGHYIDALLWGASKKPVARLLRTGTQHIQGGLAGGSRERRAFFQQHQADLLQLAQAHAKPSSAEGFAEFFREWFEGRAMEVSPGLTEKVEQLLAQHDPEFLTTIRNVREDYARWKQTDAVSRLRNHIVFDPETRRPNLRQTMEQLYTQLFNEFGAIGRATRDLLQGKPIPADQHPAILAQTLAGTPKLAELFLFRGPNNEGGAIDFDTRRKVGPSLEEVLDPIKDRWQDWSVYMVARRIQELYGRPDRRAQNQIRALQTALQMQEADFDGIVQELDSSAFQEAHQKFQEWNQALVLYLMDGGMVTKEGAARILMLNQSYFPFHRVFAAEEEMPPGPGMGPLAKQRAPVWVMKGSGRPFESPLENAIRNVYLVVSRTERNAVAHAMAVLAETTQGGGRWMERVAADIKPTRFQLEEIRRMLEEAGIPPEILDEADLELLATVFRPAHWKTRANEVWVLRAGKPVHYIVEPNLGRALLFMDRGEMAWIDRAIKALPSPRFLPLQSLADLMILGPARFLRAGATTLSPEFLGRNPFRDIFTRAAFTQVPSRLPVVGRYVDLARAFTGFGRGLLEVLGGGKYYDAWIRGGGAISHLAALDRGTLKKGLDEVLSGKHGHVIRSPVDLIRVVNGMIEQANRVAEVRAVLRAKGIAPEQATKADLIEAGLAGRDITIDFNMSGALVKFLALNRLTAFFNPQLQAWRKLVSEFGKDPWRLLSFMLSTITIPSLLLWWWQRDDPRWAEIPQWQRDISWIFLKGRITKEAWAKLDNEERTQFMQQTIIRLPKPFEFGVVFGSIPERIGEWLMGQSPHLHTSLAKTLGAALGTSVLPIPTFIEPILANLMNYSRFLGRPIVPRGLQEVEPELQLGPGTSRSVEWMARGLSTVPGAPEMLRSPMQLQHLITAWGGGAARGLLDLANVAVHSLEPGAPTPPARTWADIPGIRGFVVRFPTSQAESIEQFYELHQRSQEAARGFTVVQRMRRDPEEYARKRRFDLLLAAPLRRVADQLGAIRQEIRSIHESTELSGKEKRDLMDRRTVDMILVATQTIESYRKAEATFRGERPALAKPTGALGGEPPDPYPPAGL